MATPPGPVTQIVKGDGNVVQNNSSNLQVASVLPEPAERQIVSSAGKHVPMAAATVAALVALAWFVPLPYVLQFAITAVPLTFAVIYAGVSYFQARMAVWEKRAYLSLAFMFALDTCLRRLLGDITATAGIETGKAWFEFLSKDTEGPFVAIVKVLAIVALAYMAMKTPAIHSK